MVEPFTLTIGIGNAITSVAKASLNIRDFVKEVRDARKDLTRVNEELSSLRTTLQFIIDDLENAEIGSIAHNLEANLSVVVGACTSTVKEIEDLLTRHLRHRKTASIRWSISGKPDADRLRASLESHKASLNLSLDFIDLSLTRAIKHDTTALLDITRGMQELQTEMHCNQQGILDRVNKLQLKPLEHDVITTRHETRQSQTLNKSDVAVSVAASLTANHSDQRSRIPLESPRTHYRQIPGADKEHPITSPMFYNATPRLKGELHHALIQSLLDDLEPMLEGLSIKNIGQAESACEELLSAISNALHDGFSPKRYFKSPPTWGEVPLLGLIISKSWISQWNKSLSKKFLAAGRLCLDHRASFFQTKGGGSPFAVLLYDEMSWRKAQYSFGRSEPSVSLQSKWMDLFREYGLDIPDGPATQEILRSTHYSYSFKIVTMCISEGLPVDELDNVNGRPGGHTMMHYLCQRMLDPPAHLRSNDLDFQGKEELQFLRLLLAKGASLTIEDSNGETPSRLAQYCDSRQHIWESMRSFKWTPVYEQNLKQFMELLIPRK